MDTPASLSRTTRRAIEETLRTFARAYRAYQMYLPNNPMRAKAVEDTRRSFGDLWHHVPMLSMAIGETSLVVDTIEVYRDDERGSSALPWLMYRDGLRRLELSKGFEDGEVDMLLELLLRAKQALPDEDDLVTLLWVADFKFLTYRNVDLLTDFDASLEAVDEDNDGAATGPQLTASQLLEAELPGDGPPPVAYAELLDRSGDDESLYFLTAAEIDYLHAEVEREYAHDGQFAVMDALFDIIEGQDEVESMLEAADIIDRLVIEALAVGNYAVVAHVVREARATLKRRNFTSAAVRAALEALPERLMDVQVVLQLLEVIDAGDGHRIAPYIADFYAELQPSAAEALLVWYALAPSSSARNAIEEALTRFGITHTADLLRYLESGQRNLVRGAVRISLHVASPALVPPLAAHMLSAESAVRVDATMAVAAIASPRALQALERATADDHRDVRVAAFKAIAVRAYAPALPRLKQMLQKRSIRNADLTEKMAFFEAFGTLCGEQGVATLSEMLLGRRMFGYRESPEMRACAAHALGIIASPGAQSALQRAADTDDPVVRNAVARARRGVR